MRKMKEKEGLRKTGKGECVEIKQQEGIQRLGW